MTDWGGGARGAAGGAATGASIGSVFPGVGTALGAGLGAGLGGLLGLFGGQQDRAVVPKDIAGLRAQQIKLLQSLLQPGAFDAGGAGASFFGGGGLDELLKQTSPEMQTYNTARPILEGMLTGTGPQFERDLASANAQGGRFGSANAILRGEALRNLFNQRTQTASTLGALSGAAGSSQFQRMFELQNQHIQLLTGLLGMGGQATLSAPVVPQNNNNLGDLLKLFASVGAMRGGANTGGNTTKMPSPTDINVPPWGLPA